MGYDKTHTNKIHDIHDILNINCNPSKVTSSYRDMSGGMMMYKKKALKNAIINTSTYDY